MENLQKLEKDLQDAKEALAMKLLSVNEYSSFVYNTYQKIKELKNA